MLAPWCGGQGQAHPLNGVRVGAEPWVRPEGWLRWSAHPLGGAVCRDLALYSAFAPGTSEVAVRFWSFWILLLLICSSCACMQLLLVPYSFFVFCCLRRHLSRCKLCSKGFQVLGPSLSHVYFGTKTHHKMENVFGDILRRVLQNISSRSVLTCKANLPGL